MLPMEVGCSMVGWACLTLRLAASAFAFPYATLKIILCSSLCCLSDCWFLDGHASLIGKCQRVRHGPSLLLFPAFYCYKCLAPVGV
nr:MAG TPA: hypothetical protein [Caudoviricetes sp.]